MVLAVFIKFRLITVVQMFRDLCTIECSFFKNISSDYAVFEVV
jgi:hypothetical protein